MNKMFLLILFIIQISAQTVLDGWPNPTFFDLMVNDDGRLVANIRGGDYFGEGDPYLDVYRNFIEINRDTGTLLIVFGVAEFDLIDNGFLKTVAVKSGGVRTGPPNDATFPKPDWFNDNMVLWFDQQQHAFVLLYQEGCYSCLEKYYGEYYSHWLEIPWYDATNQTVKKSMTFDDGNSWHNTFEILKDQLENPHVQFQIIPGYELNDEGYSKEVMIPVHHLDESVTENNYQMLWRCDRAIDPQDGSWTVVNLTNTSDSRGEDYFGGHIQATIVRDTGDNTLVAFLRDRSGQWVHRTESSDDGKNWSNQQATPIPNPDLMVQAIALHSGHIMLIYNPQQSDSYTTHTADRDDNSHMLSISVSTNGGLTWQYSRMLEYAYDGKFLYPSGIQDPLCSNVYLTYSVETNEPDQGCGALNNSGAYDAYDECLERAVTMTYVKFTVLNEDWVKDPHGWELDYKGCLWDIAPEFQDELTRKKSSNNDGFNAGSMALIDLAETLSSNSVDESVTALAILLGLFATWSVALLLYTIRTNSIKVAV